MHIRIFLYSTFSLLFFIVMISCSSINLQDNHPLPKNLTFSEKISFAFHPDKIIFDDYSNAFILLNKSENTIYKTNLSGKLIQKIGESGFGDGQFINITDISCDSFGNIYTEFAMFGLVRATLFGIGDNLNYIAGVKDVRAEIFSPDYDLYSLEYKLLTGTSWTEICGGSSPDSKDILCTIDVSSFDDGKYIFRLSLLNKEIWRTSDEIKIVVPCC